MNMRLNEDAGWTMILEPRRPWLDLRLGELWHARDLILLFVRRDFVATYKQTILRPLWYLIQPLLTALTFTVIWSYFAACLTATPASPVLFRG